MKKTKKAYQEFLNNLYEEAFFKEQVVDMFAYMISDNRKNPVSKSKIQSKVYSGKAGELIRKYDPTRFEVGFSEWQKIEL